VADSGSFETHDWEVSVFASFFQVLHSVKVSRHRADRFLWVSSKKCFFKVKSFFRSLTCSDSSGFPWKSVWRTQSSFEGGFFFCVVGSPRQDPYCGQSQEATYHHCG
jgi:hypothetical protein